ncbi:DNA adenine methylase [Synechococcus sp. Nb3U1]|uniref:DNA adenine methylase n=1 Tax=Synechococcus sp. Nb3U1 TaxID=1914529 RepID=UPI001F465D8A|nr:DNA adenine methylase [Synechococcus sp. Nb3U1]MCF2971668.1 DNA adenine methylase [Synechococcus sp. Nb3U1]
MKQGSRLAAQKKARPFLKWAGGKGQLLSQYEPFFPQEWGTYHEPFLGGGAVFFHLAQRQRPLDGPTKFPIDPQPNPPFQATLSDINPELVNVYRCVRDQVEDLIAQLTLHQAQHSSDYYYALRAAKAQDSLWRAARLLYLNKTCFNGLYRENSRGHFNVPLGRYRNPRICDADNLRAASQVLQGIELAVQPFWQILERVKPGDLVYLDPPYHPLSSSSSFTAYSHFSFGEAEQRQLREVFGALVQQQVQVMLSNSDCPFVRELYRGFPVYTISASRAINSQGHKRGRIPEVLVLGR